MTDNEIIKALECCLAKENCEVVSCEKCPLEKRYECTDIMFHETIDLINRQQAEIDRYKGVIKILEKDVAEARNEGVKELAHQLIDKAEKGIVWVFDVVDLCHDLTNVLPKEGTDI